MRVAAVILAVVALAGCGGKSGTDRAADDLHASLSVLAMEETYGDILRDVRAGHTARLDTDLERYDQAARDAAGAVGESKVKRTLAAKATALGTSCPMCAAAFDRTRQTL